MKTDVNEKEIDEAELAAKEHALVSKGVTYLEPNAIRWMNKRRANSGNSAPTTHIPPARALQLRAIFKGLDFDQSESLEIDELKEAVEYVAASDTSSDPVFKDTRKIIKFFKSMDTDGNGNVDFQEFLAGMTGTNDKEEDQNQSEKLQQAFFDFANKHRRQKILESVQVKNNKDVEKYQQFMTLFSINYFKDEYYNETVAEKIERIKRDAKKDAAIINNEAHQKARKNEFARARTAAMQIESERLQKLPVQLRGRSQATSFALKSGNVDDAEYIARKIDSDFNKSLSQYSLHNERTYVPSGTKSTSLKSLRLFAMSEAQNNKINRISSFSSLPVLPPVSIKERQNASQAKAAARRAGASKK